MADIHPFGASELPVLVEPQTKDQIIAAQQRQIELLEERIGELLALLNDPRRMVDRALKLLNGKGRLGFAFGVGVLTALLATGGSLGIKAVYDASRQPQAAQAVRAARPPQAPFYDLEDDYPPSPRPSGASPSPALSRSNSAPPRPAAGSSPLPLSSPSPSLRHRHCRPSPQPDLLRCLPIPPSPPIPPIQ